MTEPDREQSTGSSPAFSLLAAERYEEQLEGARLLSESRGLALLWLTRDRWAHRVVERISFVDNERMRRLLSIDLELPWSLLDAECGSEVSSAVVPILAINAAEMQALEAKNGEGRSLPLRTATETAMITMAAVKRLLEPDATESREALRQRAAQTPAATTLGDEVEWNEESGAESLAEAVSREQLLLVDVPRADASRELVRIGWEETIHRDRPGIWLPGRIGVRVRAAAVPAARRHVEVNAPAGFEIGSLDYSPNLPEDKTSGSNAHAHVFTAGSSARDELLVSLKPKRRIALALLAPALSVFGLAIALISASALSGSQTVAGAILLAVPSLWAAYMVRTDTAGSWVGWDINGLVVGLTSFLAAGALVLEVGQLALDLTLAIAAVAGAITAIAAAASTTLDLKLDHERTRQVALVSYFASSFPSSRPTDEEVNTAVERLIESAYDTKSHEHNKLWEQAGNLAEERSFVEIPRPQPPQLSGVLAEDVLKLTEMRPEVLATQLSIPPRVLKDRLPDNVLGANERQKLAAVRAAALTLYGGLDRRGVTQWLSSGDDPPLNRIAHGEIEGVQRQLDRYLSSPAE